MKWSTKGIKTTLDILKELLIVIILGIILLGIILGRIDYIQLINIINTRPSQKYEEPILPQLPIQIFGLNYGLALQEFKERSLKC